MTQITNPMISIVQKFLDKHFPHDKHRVTEGGSEILVSVGDDDMKLFFDVCGNSVYNVSIHKNHLEDICPLFGLDTYYTDSSLILNTFTAVVNNNKLFNEVFKPIEPMNFSRYFTKSFSDDFMTFYDSDTKFTLRSKVGNKEYGCIAQFSYRFTKGNNLKPMAAISLINNTESDFRVGFNLDQQTIHVTKETVNIFEDFFIQNKLFNEHEDIDKFVTNFVDNVITKFHEVQEESTSPFYTDDVSFYDKLPLFEMIHI